MLTICIGDIRPTARLPADHDCDNNTFHLHADTFSLTVLFAMLDHHPFVASDSYQGGVMKFSSESDATL